ncbi:MAG: hypothetical protein OHK0022_11830 [Roseiflexaceae bacterium]
MPFTGEHDAGRFRGASRLTTVSVLRKTYELAKHEKMKAKIVLYFIKETAYGMVLDGKEHAQASRFLE